MPRKTRLLSLVAACALLATAAPAAVEERLNLSADSLELWNLIGEIRVEGHSGSEFEVEVVGRGEDLSAERLRIEATEGANARIDIRFPVEETRRFVYPGAGRGQTQMMLGGDWDYPSKKKIEVSGRGSGLEIWADVTIRVPAGKSLSVRLGVGEIGAEGIKGDLDLDTNSGDVGVVGVEGDLRVDTGSGHVTAGEIRGRVDVDTGSGQVEVKDADGESIHVDTGSGAVTLLEVRGSRVDVDTGSGRVEARGMDADNVNIDTGSGAVRLELERMGDGRFRVDTGSGAIKLKLPRDASAKLRASTGSGGISLDLGPEAIVEDRDDFDVRARIGSGNASINLDTGSGSITISH